MALVALVAVELGAGYLSAALEIPYKQALELVVGLPVLVWAWNWHPKPPRPRARRRR